MTIFSNTVVAAVWKELAKEWFEEKIQIKLILCLSVATMKVSGYCNIF